MAFLKEGPYALTEDPPIWKDFQRVLADAGYPSELGQIERMEFYKAAARDEVSLTIATAEQRIYANLLLTIGVVMP
jgi:L-fucose mutarotase